MPVSSTVTTTNSDGDTITTTVTELTVITLGPEPGTSDSANLRTVAKFFPSTVPKQPSVEVADGQDDEVGGLSKAQIGGAVAGVILILLAILAAAFFIIRRLKKTAKAVALADSKRGTSSGQPRSRKTSFGQPTVTEVDGNFDVDPLVKTPSSVRPSHLRLGSDDTTTLSERSLNHTPNMPSTSSTPPLFSGQYSVAPIPEAPSEVPDFFSSGGANDAFRYSQQTIHTAQRISYDSQISHSRNHSDASELSGTTVDGPAKSELDSKTVEQEEAAGVRARRASTSAAARPSLTSFSSSPSSSHVRRSSGGGGAGTAGARGRSESAAAALALGTVNEFGELHGYYGPPHQAVGQTADRLGREASTASSTASRDLKEAAARLRRGDSSVSATPTEAYRKGSGSGIGLGLSQ
ncbi:hypothetical protein SLS62_001603 [Diatrype stigma]|uniref:Uncharacterized protein n=1 Tax=Diatrype stigma TaxID=117547 RepID=A0AAN9YVP3_9PEZI